MIRSRAYRIIAMVALSFVLAGCKGSRTPVVVEDVPSTDGSAKISDLFQDVTAASGIKFSYRNGEEAGHLAILESLGAGIAMIDFDQDGLLDLYVPGGGYYDGENKKEIRGHAGRFFRNTGNCRFEDVTEKVGLGSLAGNVPWFYSHAASVCDYDRDGWPDLLVTGWRRVALFHNEASVKGGRHFVEVSAKAGLDKDILWATSSAWADFDGDAWPDLYVCQYVDWSFNNHPACDYDGKTPDVCPPKRFAGLNHKLYRNLGNGTFLDVSVAAGLKPGGSNSSKGLGVLAVDVNADCKPDLYVANDTVDNFLYVNESKPGSIRFREEGVLAWVARDGNGSANGSMGVDAGDPECSGMPSLWVTNYEKEMHGLYRNRSKKDLVMFLFHTPASGIGAIGKSFVGWGTGFLDFDHDGWEDLFIANGHAIRYPTGSSRQQFPVLLRNIGGKFKDLSDHGGSYFKEPHLARGVALGDLDNDGKIDIVVSHLNEPVSVLRSTAGDGMHWLGIELRGAEHGDVVGTRVIIETGDKKQSRFAKGGGSYASASDRRLVFGLGKSDSPLQVKVIWPTGEEQAVSIPTVDQYWIITLGAKQPSPVKAVK